MATIKTAISLQDHLFQQVEGMARELKVSRSQVVALALEAFIQRYQNQLLLARLNEAYQDGEDGEEATQKPARRQHHRRMVEANGN
jgi:metal-responsive CopG/Arc/MetJ family transcriptional regulator